MHEHFRHTHTIVIVDRSGAIFYWTLPDLFDNNVPFDNITPIYLINPLWKLVLGLGLDLELHYCRSLYENNENEHFISLEFHGK